MKIFTYLCISIIRGYQKMISRYTPPSCRFSPTCSSYSIRAFRDHGVIYGFILTAFRILRCNPFNSGGKDPVPKDISLSYFISRE